MKNSELCTHVNLSIAKLKANEGVGMLKCHRSAISLTCTNSDSKILKYPKN